MDLLHDDEVTAAGTSGPATNAPATNAPATSGPVLAKASSAEAPPVSDAGNTLPTDAGSGQHEPPKAHRLRRGPRHAAPEPDPAVALAAPVASETVAGGAGGTAGADPETDPETPADAGAKPARRRSRGGRLRSTGIRALIVLLVAVVVAVLLRAFVVEPYYIPSESMEPTLHGCAGCSDDHVLVDKISYRFQSVHAGDIVVFNTSPAIRAAGVMDKVIIKRVIALAGDTVQLRRTSAGQWDGKVYVNGLALEESYVNKACPAPQTVPLTATSTWKVPDNQVFVMGDNRCRSDDSRAFGPITTSSIIGRAVLIVWPLSRFGGI